MNETVEHALRVAVDALAAARLVLNAAGISRFDGPLVRRVAHATVASSRRSSDGKCTIPDKPLL